MKDKFRFEDALQKLEGIVENLEGGNISLEESIKAFKEGNELVKKCLVKLSTAEEEIKNIIEKSQIDLDLND